MKAVDFGFLFSRVVRFYGIDPERVLAMPVKRFWMMQKNIDRLAAEEDIRSLMVVANSQSGEGVTELLASLRKQMGQVLVLDEAKAAIEMEIDREGLAELREMARIR